MSKQFPPWKIDEVQLLPPSMQDYVAKDHVSRLIVALVRESLELCAISGSYTSGLGQPPFDPRMMTALLLHGYASGLYSSRRIAKAGVERADFMMIVAGDPPDFRTISEFRRRHLRALAGACAVAAQKNNMRPPDVLLQALGGHDDRLQSLTVAGRKGEGDAAAHTPDSHAKRRKGIQIRTLSFRSIH